MEKKICGIGIAGAGKIVPDFAQACAQVPGLQMAAIYARRKEAREQRMQQFGILRGYGTYEELLADAQVDTVYVALPNSLHFAFAKQALEHGKNVLLEKPATVTLAEYDALCTLAQKKHCLLMEAITSRDNPNFKKLKELLPQVGAVRVASFSFSQFSSRYLDFLQNKIAPAFDPALAGGALMDINVYNVHLAMALFGRPERVAYYPTVQKNIDTSGVLVLQYADKCCTLIGAKDCSAPNGFTVQGENGTLYGTGNPSMVPEVCFLLRGEKVPQIFTLREDRPRLYEELVAYEKIWRDENWQENLRRQALSRTVMEVLDEARKALPQG